MVTVGALDIESKIEGIIVIPTLPHYAVDTKVLVNYLSWWNRLARAIPLVDFRV